MEMRRNMDANEEDSRLSSVKAGSGRNENTGIFRPDGKCNKYSIHRRHSSCCPPPILVSSRADALQTLQSPRFDFQSRSQGPFEKVRSLICYRLASLTFLQQLSTLIKNATCEPKSVGLRLL